MNTLSYLTILVSTLTSCSSLQSQRSRSPSSLSGAEQSCSQIVSTFISKADKSFTLKELKNLDINLKSIKSNSNFRDLASLNGNKEIQEKTYYILALIKKQNLDDSTDEIIKKYSLMLKECP